MKAMMSGCLAVVCATMFAACGVEPASQDQNASADTSETSADLTAPVDGKVIQVPPELSADQLDDLEISGNDATTNACHVTLLFCSDSRFGGLPSFKQSGC